MTRRWGVLSILALCLALALTGGCAKKKLLAIANLPPETTLFVQGPVDTVANVVHLYWFGSDPDGSVSGYEVRFMNPAAPADSHWVPTARTDSVITVFAPSGYSAPTFEVRAIDNEGLRDPTPALEDFKFSNQAPTVTFSPRLRMTDTTYASATLSWIGNDPDGDAGAIRYQIGLDTIPAALTLVAGSSATIDTSAFQIAGAYPSTRPRQAYIRAIDGGGRASGWDSVRWVVRQPATPGVHPRLLLIDDVPSTNPSAFGADTMWANNVGRALNPLHPAGSFSILRLEFTQPFKSSKDVLQTFRLFDAVIWYRHTQGTFSALLSNYQDAIAAYLDGGGKVVLEGRNLIDGVNSVGPLRGDWVTRYLGSTALINSPIAGRVDSTVSWTITAGFIDTVNAVPVLRNIILRSPAFQDSMWNRAGGDGLRGFEVRDTNYVAMWAADSALLPRMRRSVPVAVTVPVPENRADWGRIVMFTAPIRGTNGYGNAPRLLSKVFQQLGLTGPGP